MRHALLAGSVGIAVRVVQTIPKSLGPRRRGSAVGHKPSFRQRSKILLQRANERQVPGGEFGPLPVFNTLLYLAFLQRTAEFEACLESARFKNCGVSYGMAFDSETRSGSQLLIRADGRMYQNKTGKRSDGGRVVRAVA